MFESDFTAKTIFNFDIGYHGVIVESPMATAGARSQALPRGCLHKNEVRANSKYFPFFKIALGHNIFLAETNK